MARYPDMANPATIEVPGPRNQIEALEKELAARDQVIREQQQELLTLYRRLDGTDRSDRY